MLAFAIQLGTFSCRGYGKLVVALQTLSDTSSIVSGGRGVVKKGPNKTHACSLG